MPTSYPPAPPSIGGVLACDELLATLIDEADVPGRPPVLCLLPYDSCMDDIDEIEDEEGTLVREGTEFDDVEGSGEYANSA